MKTKRLLEEIQNSPKVKKREKRKLSHRENEKDTSKFQFKKKRHITPVIHLPDSEDECAKLSTAIQLYPELTAWAGEWHVFLRNFLFNLQTEEGNRGDLLGEYHRLTMELNTIKIKLFMEPTEALRILGASRASEKLSNDKVSQQENFQRILSSIDQVNNFTFETDFNRYAKGFINKIVPYIKKIDRILHDNILELSEREGDLQKYLGYLKTNSTYEGYEKVTRAITHFTLKRLEHMQGANYRNLERLQRYLNKLTQHNKNQSPFKNYVISLMNERILMLKRDIGLFKSLIDNTHEYLQFCQSNIQRLQGLAHQLLELEHRIPDNTEAEHFANEILADSELKDIAVRF